MNPDSPPIEIYSSNDECGRDDITPTAEKMEDDMGCMSPSQVVTKNGSHPAEYAYSNKMTDGTS